MSEKHKTCMLGASGVGKTSLVRRFARSIFSEAYQTTIGVTIERKAIRCDDREIDLVIWDLNGEDEFQSVGLSYTRGASGFVVVADGTRGATLEVALRLRAAARVIVGDVPCVLVLNKCDLVATWEIDEGREAALSRGYLSLIKTSAKTGAGVEGVFETLARAVMIDRGRIARGA